MTRFGQITEQLIADRKELAKTLFPPWWKFWRRPPKARGQELDFHAEILGIERKHYWWFFKESDRSLRRRTTVQLRPS